jgi:hypothetical protein
MDFNLETHKRRASRLEWADLDLAGVFQDRPLDAGTLRCLRYMHDVEVRTVCWVYEEFWHGEALADVLAAHSETARLDA